MTTTVKAFFHYVDPMAQPSDKGQLIIYQSAMHSGVPSAFDRNLKGLASVRAAVQFAHRRRPAEAYGKSHGTLRSWVHRTPPPPASHPPTHPACLVAAPMRSGRTSKSSKGTAGGKGSRNDMGGIQRLEKIIKEERKASVDGAVCGMWRTARASGSPPGGRGATSASSPRLNARSFTTPCPPPHPACARTPSQILGDLARSAFTESLFEHLSDVAGELGNMVTPEVKEAAARLRTQNGKKAADAVDNMKIVRVCRLTVVIYKAFLLLHSMEG